MTKKNLPEPVEALVLALLVFFGVVILSYTMGSASSKIFSDISVEINTTVFYLFSKSLFLIIPFYYTTKKGYSTRQLFKFKAISGSTIFFTIILGISLFIIVDEIDRLITFLIPPPEALKEMMKPLEIDSTTQWLLIFVGSVLIAPLAEESMFRGFLLTSLLKKGDATRAVILTAVSWAIIHPNPYWAIPIFMLGVFIGYVAWKTQSLWPAIIIHATYNFLLLLVINENISGAMGWYTMGAHISPVVLVLAFAGVYYSIKFIDSPVIPGASSEQPEKLPD